MINMEMIIFIGRLVAAAIIAYLLGSVNTSVIVGKLYGIDIRKEGSGNAGLTNTLRTLGKRAALLVLVGDILKGVVSIMIAKIIAPVFTQSHFIPINGEVQQISIQKVYYELSMMIAGIAVVIGHIFPVFFKFKGGKGVLTAITVLLMTQWQVGLACLVVFFVTVLLTRYVSLGSVLAAFSAPFLIIALEEYISIEAMSNTYNWIIFTVILAFIIIIGHRSNLVRLFNNTERKLGEKKEEYEKRIANLK